MAKMNAARKAFFVFSKAVEPQDREALMKRLRA